MFCNRARDKIKVLVWYRNGFWMWYRRLEKQRFWWPAGTEQIAVELSVRELQWLLEGLDPTTVQGHRGTAEALPLAETVEILRTHGVLSAE